jgi:hypothetical protein
MELNLTLPRSWKELNGKQLIYLSWLMTGRELSPSEMHAYAFVRFTGIRILKRWGNGWLCRYKKQVFCLTAEQVAFFCRRLCWLTGPLREVRPLERMAKRTPVDGRLRGTPFKQYLALENYYQAYLFTKDTGQLSCLCAAFYTGGLPFKDERTAERSKEFDKLPIHIRNTAFLWFYGLKSVMENAFPHFFERQERMLEDEILQAPNMRQMVNNMIRTLSGGDVTKIEQVYNTETWEALAELNARALEYKEYERRINKLKSK